MAITSVRLINFKCFEDSGDIPFAPLTLIVGKNNSGKSSILHSLLILRQTIDSSEYEARLNLRGPLHAAGTYADLVHRHETKRHVRLKIGVRADDGTAGAVEFEFGPDEPRGPKLLSLVVNPSGVDSVAIRRGVGAGGPFELHIGDENLGNQHDARFELGTTGLMPLFGPEPRKVGRPNRRREAARNVARILMQDLASSLEAVRAVGPFRQQPERRYDYGGSSPNAPDVGGARVVDALIEDATRKKRRGDLRDAVNRWLRSVGRVTLEPLRRISRGRAHIFELRLKDVGSGQWANFADVGFGIGQAVPVIVEGLRTAESGAFLVQEPEIHLHPDAQLAMADFLVDLALHGRTVVAETHSEHLLLRVRRRVVERTRRHRGPGPESVRVIFVEKGKKGASHVRTLELDDLGHMAAWPSGFMDQATDERLALMEAVAERTNK